MSNNPANLEDKGVLVMVGTRKGGFVFRSDYSRKKWRMSNLMFKSWNVTDMTLDPRNHRLHAAAVHDVYGPSTHYSDDMGRTWVQAAQVPQFVNPSQSGRPLGTPDEARGGDATFSKPESVIKIWKITPGREFEPGVLYAGIEPAALFKSYDNGETWQINQELYNHPHRADWFPGAGGLGLHTILLHPSNPDRMYVAISTGGTYRTDDGGKSWIPRNKNIRADFLPEKYPEFGQCVHAIDYHPSQPDVLFQQNHCGIYRSEDGGDDWVDIGADKLPSRFGFPIIVHPNEPDTAYVVLEESDDYRLSIDGEFSVWRTRDKGDTWEKLNNGLPDRAYLVVLRQAAANGQSRPGRDLPGYINRSDISQPGFWRYLGSSGGFSSTCLLHKRFGYLVLLSLKIFDITISRISFSLNYLYQWCLRSFAYNTCNIRT